MNLYFNMCLREFLPEILGNIDFFLFLKRDVGIHGMTAVCPIDDAADHGCLHGGRHIDGHGAFFAGGKGTEGGFVLKLFAVVKDSHDYAPDVYS